MKAAAKACFVATLFALSMAHAEDIPAFDRPGIAFATTTLPQGGIAWEQGLPDFSTDRSQGQRVTTWTADSLLRVGLPAGTELQLGADSYGGVMEEGGGLRSHQSGGGDGRIGIKWAPVIHSSQVTVALLGAGTLPIGKAPVGGDGRNYDVGITGSWSMPADTSVSLYADRSWGDGGSGWLFSPSYSFPVGGSYGGYVEAGFGTSSAYTRVAGGGLTHMLSEHLQLDASFLRGLTGKSQDWQGGIGLAWYVR